MNKHQQNFACTASKASIIKIISLEPRGLLLFIGKK